MESYQIKSDILESLNNEINAINTKLLDSLKGKKDVICTEEFVKICFSSNILEDIELLNKLSGNPLFKIRHANLIIRDMIEQVIEFIYLMKNKNMIPDYMGVNSTINALSSNPIKEFHKLASGRFSDGRKSISEMARDIGEKKSLPNHPALYELYQLLSEECHNSYFFSYLDNVEEVKTGKETIALTEEQAQNLLIITGYFMDTFRK